MKKLFQLPKKNMPFLFNTTRNKALNELLSYDDRELNELGLSRYSARYAV